MRKSVYALAALSAVLLASPAFAATTTTDQKSDTSYQQKDDGSYTAKEKTESTDAAGTTVEHTATKKVDVDSNGNKTTSVDIKNSTDPKGLMNKTSTEVKNKAVEKDGESKYTHKKIVNGKTVEDKTDETDTTK